MKSNFEYTVIGIIGFLFIVFLFQLFWLKGLYDTINTETEKKVLTCLENANVDDLQYRLDRLERSGNYAERPPTMSMSASQSLGNNNDSNVIRHKHLIQGNDTVYALQENRKEKMSLRQMEQFSGNLLKEVTHRAIDSIYPIDLNIVDSFLIVNLKENDIAVRLYRIEIVDLNTDSVISRKITEPLHSKAETLSCTFDSENRLAYRIHIGPLTKTVLYQMQGILVTTFLIIITLGFAFWYLIRTILYQRTLEEMKDDFTNNMTHELKTPLAVAYSAADTLLNFKQGDDKEKRNKYLSICKEQLSELSGLIEQILSMSMERRRSFILNKEDVSIASLVDNLVVQHTLKSDKETTFNITIDPEDMVIHADRTHLNNMISNLIDNAVKYSGGSVIIDITVYRKDHVDIVEVKDNGVGIPSEKLAYVFDKFYRVTSGNKYGIKGYGLGLFYVKTMAEKHGGSVFADSSKDGGSTFTIKIPHEK